MRKIKTLITVLLVSIASGLFAQNFSVKGQIISPEKQPVKGAVVSVTGAERSVQTSNSGEFEIVTTNPMGIISVSAEGYYEMSQPLNNRVMVEIVLIPIGKSKYNVELVSPYLQKSAGAKFAISENISKKDFGTGITLESAMQGEISGLQVKNKSGMPGEGAYLNLRGIKSLVTNNSPLIVINGIPYMPGMEDSPIIGAYSKSIFGAIDINDIQNITVLKGADASLYGSLGSNGVIMIETNGTASDELNTKITFSSQYGLNINNKSFPLLGVDDYKSYLSDVGLTYYNDMEDIFNNFPFLKDDPNYHYNYLYNNNTDWQNEIYAPSAVTDNVLRVEGGDAVAKYDISLGYMRNGGVLKNTNQERYQTQINANIMINRKLELLTTVGLAYLQGQFQEQGMLDATNPILVSYNKSPLLSPYRKDSEGNVLEEYDEYRYDVSNPVAIVNSLEARNKQYDVNLRLGLNYSLNDDLSLSAIMGLYYNYNQENIFIPGRTTQTIVPMNYDLAKNSVRAGVARTKNMYYNLHANYQKELNNIHNLNFSAGFQTLTTNREYDAGSGYNTASDFYQTLDYVEDGSEKFYGYINEWNWMNFYGHGDYTWNNLLRASANLAVDGSSSSGIDTERYAIFPSAGITFLGKNLKGLINSSFLNRLDLRAEYGITGNSRFSANYAKNYYHSAPFRSLSGIVRSNIPNTKLKWESTKQFDIGFDLSLLRHRFDLSFDYYLANTNDALFAQPISSVFGSDSHYFNAASIENKGVEVSFSLAVVQTKNFEWTIGGNIAMGKSKITKLGDVEEDIITFSDGAQIITRLNENPYCFYGYVAEGIIASEAEANSLGLTNWMGSKFQAGDVHYKDVDGNKIINDKDRQLIGSATPDFFGGFYSAIKVSNFTLSAEFVYSSGNEAYNGVRRSLEAMESFNNQSAAAVNRWQFDGQITNIPRANYDDPLGNNAFSSMWIEDASYLKMRSITLDYGFDKTLLGFFRSGSIYLTGENLLTFTKYLGLDPEFAYSYNDAIQGFDYCKVPLPKTVKFGFILKF